MGLFSKMKEKRESDRVLALYNKAKEAGKARDYETAFRYYQEAAELGHLKAIFQLGHMYFRGVGTEKDGSKAIELYEKTVKSCEGDSLDVLRMKRETLEDIIIYLPRICVEEGQPQRGYDWLHKLEWLRAGETTIVVTVKDFFNVAARKGAVISGPYEDGMRFYEAKNYRLAFCYFEGGAKLGESRAQWMLGRMYEKGEDVKEDKVKALSWYEKAAEQGMAEAQFRCGEMYRFESGIERNVQKSLKWYEKAAEQGHADAQVRCAEHYQSHGDDDKAMYWAEKAKENGGKGAKEIYWRIESTRGYQRGKALYDAGKYSEALQILQDTSGKGMDYYYSNFLCAQMYRKGLGTQKNEKCAIEYYKNAVNHLKKPSTWKYVDEAEDAEHALAGFANYAFLNECEERMTLPALEDAAELGYIFAFFDLAVLYQACGEKEKAAYWFKKWLHAVKPGQGVWFGRFPQEGAYMRELECERDLVHWEVLHVEEDRALLLCSVALLYEDFLHIIDNDDLFSEKEKAIVLEERLLSHEECQRYVIEEKAASASVSPTLYARTVAAVCSGLDVDYDRKTDGYSVGYTSYGSDEYEKDKARWGSVMSTVTEEYCTWGLQGGYYCDSAGTIYTPEQGRKRSGNRFLAIRSAVWLGVKKTK